MNSFLEPPPDTRKGQLDGCSIKVSAYEAAETPPTEPPEVVVSSSHQTGGEPNPAEAGGGMPSQSKKPALVASSLVALTGVGYQEAVQMLRAMTQRATRRRRESGVA
jgi:hypothetical protein